MKTSLSWTQKEPLVRVLVVLACLSIVSFVLVIYQFKLWIVDHVDRPVLFWANVVVTVVIGLFFQGVALACNARLRSRADTEKA